VKTESNVIDRLLALTRIDVEPTHGQPSIVMVGLATVLAVVGSLLADAAVVAIGTAIFPTTKGYAHFRFPDYAKLTIIGVLIACLAWPVVTRITSSPRWLFVRLAIAVSAVLLLPDVWLVAKHQPHKAVAVLVAMHIAIAVVTYNALVRVAPVRSRAARER
jgi:ABC-type uncharacterized transport system permease subunit